MCLLLLGYRLAAEWPLVLAANRDEFHQRPTRAAHWWPDRPVLAGRDLEAGGTWMGVHRSGRFAAITNYRDPPSHRPQARSRGELVLRALAGEFAGASGRDRLRAEGSAYNSFNLLFGDAEGLWYYSDRQASVRALPPGLYGLSNHLLETPWPKVQRGREQLQAYLDGPRLGLTEPLLELLGDRSQPPERQLPQTGVPPEWERLLAPIFIVDPRYGTRASTCLLQRADGRIRYVERSYGAAGEALGTQRFEFRKL